MRVELEDETKSDWGDLYRTTAAAEKIEVHHRMPNNTSELITERRLEGIGMHSTEEQTRHWSSDVNESSWKGSTRRSRTEISMCDCHIMPFGRPSHFYTRRQSDPGTPSEIGRTGICAPSPFGTNKTRESDIAQSTTKKWADSVQETMCTICNVGNWLRSRQYVFCQAVSVVITM